MFATPSEGRGQVGPARVWLATENVPGLAMSRSIGDDIAHQAGVISEPHITKHDIGSKDQFVVTATDGLWETMTASEVAKIVVKCQSGDREGSALKLVRESR